MLYPYLIAAVLAAGSYHWVRVAGLEAQLAHAEAKNAALDAAHELAKQERERADASAAGWRKLYRDVEAVREAERDELDRMHAQATKAAREADQRAQDAQAALDGWRRRAAAPTEHCAALLRLPLAACGDLAP